MRKPKKPTKTSKFKILQDSILHEWDGKTAVEIIKILRDCLIECPNAEFNTDWNYDSTDCQIIGTEDDDSFNDRMLKYEEDMIEWRKFRIEQLNAELKGLE